MDCSSDYIKMCEKAAEIQELRKEKDGDFFSRGLAGVEVWSESYTAEYGDKIENADVWLPRQDQLQEMLLIEPINSEWICNPTDSELAMLFVDFIDNEIDRRNQLRLTESMEQLWLSFTMAEKFNKYWDGESWVT